MLDIIDWYDTDLLIFKDNYFQLIYETDQYLNFTIRATDVGFDYDQSFTLNVIDDVT